MSIMTKEEGNEFFAHWLHGKHHIPRGGVKEWGDGWCINHYGDLSTFDFNKLTTLVFLAHDFCYRVELQQGAPRTIKICIFKRDAREGRLYSKHPTIETALAEWRKRYPVEGCRLHGNEETPANWSEEFPA